MSNSSDSIKKSRHGLILTFCEVEAGLFCFVLRTFDWNFHNSKVNLQRSRINVSAFVSVVIEVFYVLIYFLLASCLV